MNARQERVLDLAREAWRAGQPSEVQVEAAARRIQKRMHPPRRVRPARRHTLILAFIVVFFGAAAWAASAGAPQIFGQGPSPGAPVKMASAARGGLGGGLTALTDRQRAATPAPVADDPSPAPAAEPRAPRASTKPAAAPAPAASWREVAQALDAKDDAKARQALEGLSQSSDATTAAKARLGLAQLAKSRGDCVTARRLAGEVAAQGGVDPSVQKRAAALSAECD